MSTRLQHWLAAATAGFFLVLGIPCSSPAQELQVELGNPALNNSWIEARNVFHQTWFERADDLFQGLSERKPDFALAHAYRSVIDAMLYRDLETEAQLALEFAAQAPEGEKLMSQALVAFARGELEQCDAILESFLTLYPEDRYAQHVRGFTAIDRGLPGEGVIILQALLKLHPSYSSAFNHLGYGLAATKRSEEARQAFAAFLAGDPGNPSGYDSLAEWLASAGETDAAIAHLTRSLLLEPRFAYGWRHMGDILTETGEDSLALAAYEQAISSAAKYGPDFVSGVEKQIGNLR